MSKPQDLDVEQYKKLEQTFKDEFHTSPSVNYYIIATSWLQAWKRKYGYDGQEKPQEYLPSINANIGMKPKVVLKYDPLETHMWNTVLQEGLVEGQDYEIISEDMWNFLRRGQKVDFTIQRDSHITTEKRKVVNVYPMKLKFAPIFPSMASKFKGGSTTSSSMIEGDQYVSRTTTLRRYIELLERTLQTVTAHNFLRTNSVRLYKAPPEWGYDDLTKLMNEQMKDLVFQDAPTFSFPQGEYLDPDKIGTLEDCNIEPDQMIVMDAKEAHKTWVIKNPIFPDEGKCEGCYQFKVLCVLCECKKVSYCTEECRAKDEFYHLPKCEKEESDEEKLNALGPKETSRNGITGLRNLGNTCFMNSGIQCISNTVELVQYLLDNKYKAEINLENPLGSKGRLISKLSNLVRKIWYDNKASIAPFSFKKTIGELQPQFQGYQQHDSQELITFVLDSIHEDLNRILIKPYIENPDSTGRPDLDVALETWQLYRKRNDSVVIDNMYGMYRSQLQCPTCSKISITFDPYLMVNVAIPQDNRKVLKVSLVNPHCIWDTTEEVFHYDRSKNLKMKDVIDEKGQEWLNVNEQQVVLTCSSLYNQEDAVFIDEMLHILKKKLKYRKLFLRRLSEQEQSVPLDSRVIVLVHNSYHQSGSYSWKKDYIEPQNFIFSRLVTYQGIHLEMYRAHINVLKDFPDFDPMWITQTGEEEIQTYKTHILNKFWTLEFKSNQKYMVPCSYCQKDSCNDCPIPFDETLDLNTCLERGEKLMMAEFYIVWKVPFRFNGRVDDAFDDWKRHKLVSQNDEPEQQQQQQNEEQTQGPEPFVPNNGAIPLPASAASPIAYEAPKKKKEETFTLQQCLQFSQKPEQLAEDNTWYCNQCKDHVQAFKTMQVYMAPKVLIFHLKRFKDSNKYFKSKLQTLVEFPIDGLDMKDYLLEPRMPQQLEEVQQDVPSTLYDLYAVCNHFGGLGGGHYTAYAKNHLDQKWYNFDDAKVTEIIDTRTIIGSQAYVLFYRRRI